MNTQSLPLNPIKLRHSIQRMFNGTGRQILSEILQNTQRAHATKLEIIAYYDSSNDSYHLSFKDNGQGLKTLEDFRKLVSLGDTGFDENVIEKQDPAGIGLNSILANEGCISLNITSGGYYIEIDKERWWNDLEYWKNWTQLLKLDYPIVSDYTYTLSVTTTEKLFVDILEELNKCTKKSYHYGGNLAITLGYSNYFEIVLKTNCLVPAKYSGFVIDFNKDNNLLEEKLITNFLDKTDINILTETEYKGGKLIIYYLPYYTPYLNSIINWYGQLIQLEKNCKISFYYEYTDSSTSGLIPTHPTRDNIIKNTAYNELIDFVGLTLINYLNKTIKESFELGALQGIEVYKDKGYNYHDLLIETCNYIKYYKLSNKYIELINWLPLYNIDTCSIEIIDINTIDYTKTIIFKGEDVLVKFPNEDPISMHCTLSNFVDDITFVNKYYLFNSVFETNSKLKLSTLVWIVGNPIENPYSIDLHFYELGELAIIPEHTTSCMHKDCKYIKIVNAESILAFDNYANCDYLEFDNICVSLKTFNTESVLDFISNRLEEIYSSECFYYDDYNNNTIDSFYELVVDPYIRAVKGNCIKEDFTLWDLKSNVQTEDIPFNKVVITNVEYIYNNVQTITSVKVTFTNSLEKHLEGTANYSTKILNIYK